MNLDRLTNASLYHGIQANNAKKANSPNIVRIIADELRDDIVRHLYEPDVPLPDAAQPMAGRSLMPLLYGDTTDARNFVFSQIEHAYMVRSGPIICSASTGEGDRCVMAYNYRLILTDDPDNLVAITCPDNYDPSL